MSQLTEETIAKCRKKLISMKQDILNRFRQIQIEQVSFDKAGGDEGDQSVAHIEEHSFLVTQERMRTQLFELEQALARIELGSYGVCEETQEPIETDRLLAIPWTRLSIEGAEMREAVGRKFAR